MHPFLGRYTSGTSDTVALRNLVDEGIREWLLDAGHELFCIGKDSHTMYMVVSGDLCYTIPGRSHSVLSKSSWQTATGIEMSIGHPNWLCEQALWLKHWKHVGSALGVSPCQVGAINAKMFQACLGRKYSVIRYAGFFLEHVRTHDGYLTDASLNFDDVVMLTDRAF